MTNRSIAALAFRIAGLYAFLQMLSLVQSYILYLSMQSSNNSGQQRMLDLMILTHPVLLIVYGLLAWSLIFRCHDWAARLFPSEEEPVRSGKILAVHEFAISLLGLYLSGISISRLPQMVPTIVSNPNKWQAYATSIGLILQLAFGVVLFTGSSFFIRLWTRFRHAGLRRAMGLCIRCGYDLTGNTSGVCPECGTNQNPAQ